MGSGHKYMVGAVIEEQRSKAVKLIVRIHVVKQDGTEYDATRRIWLPKSVVNIEAPDRIGCYLKFVQMKEEEIAKDIDAKCVGIQVEE